MISVVDKIDIGMLKVIVDADAQLPSFVKVARREWYDSVTYVPIENVSRLQREKFKLEDENTKLRELVLDMWQEGMCECGSHGKCKSCMYDYPTRMRELGVEVDE